VNLSFWLSSASFSGGAKVFAEHARRLRGLGHEVVLTVGRPEAELPAGCEALVVTRYRDVAPALRAKERVIHLVQGLDVPEGGALARWRKRRRVARAFAASTAKIAVSKHLAARWPGARHAPMGVDTSTFAPGERSPRRVLVNGLGPTKRIDLAFSVLGRLRGIEVVHLTPHAGLEEPQAAALIRSASVYLSTVTPEEGFDLVALEAMASGVACVLSGGGAHAELAPALIAGCEPAALAECVRRALEDPAEHARRAAIGLEAARMRAWERVLPEIEACYRRFVAR